MQISNLLIKEGSWHAGLTQATHLRTFFLTEPEMATQVVTRIYNKQNGFKNALSLMTGGVGKAKEMNDIIYRWSVMGDSRKAIPITKAVFEGATTYPGIAGSTFKLGIGEKWFTEGDVLIPDDARYSFRIVAPIEYDGVDFIITCQMITNNQADYVPSALLAVGKELSKEFNAVENDHSRTSGETHYATPLMLENYMTTLRKSYSITGAAHDKVLNITLTNPDGSE